MKTYNQLKGTLLNILVDNLKSYGVRSDKYWSVKYAYEKMFSDLAFLEDTIIDKDYIKSRFYACLNEVEELDQMSDDYIEKFELLRDEAWELDYILNEVGVQVEYDM